MNLSVIHNITLVLSACSASGQCPGRNRKRRRRIEASEEMLSDTFDLAAEAIARLVSEALLKRLTAFAEAK